MFAVVVPVAAFASGVTELKFHCVITSADAADAKIPHKINDVNVALMGDSLDVESWMAADSRSVGRPYFNGQPIAPGDFAGNFELRKR
jgi:hypothetical protein